MNRDQLPPGPFTYTVNSAVGRETTSGFVYLLDANGRKIAALWGKLDEKVALAELICGASETAVNA